MEALRLKHVALAAAAVQSSWSRRASRAGLPPPSATMADASCRCRWRETDCGCQAPSAATRVAPASCRLLRGRLALGAADEDARPTAAGTAALPSILSRNA